MRIKKFSHIRDHFLRKAEDSFQRLQASRAGEFIYAFALITDEDAFGASAMGNTRQRLSRIVFANPNAGHLARFCIRLESEWYPPDWYESHSTSGTSLANDDPANHDSEETLDESESLSGYEEFRNAWLSRHEDNDEGFRRIIYRAMCDALKLLDERGCFGTGSARRQLTLFITVTDSEERSLVEIESATQLNPWHLFRRLPSEYPFPLNWMQFGYHSVRRLFKGAVIAKDLPE